MNNTNQNNTQKSGVHPKKPWYIFADWVNGEEPEDKMEKSEQYAVPQETHELHENISAQTVLHSESEHESYEKGHFLLKEYLTKFYKMYFGLSLIVGCVVVGILIYAVCTLPGYGLAENPTNNEVAQKYLEEGLEDTGAVNSVAGMILDYRAFDTFGESTVLFVAVAAVIMLMKRSMNKKNEARERLVAHEITIDKKDPNLVLKYSAVVLVPLTILFGIYVVLNGHISPGGGFSGGAIIGAGLMLYALAFGHDKISKVIHYRSFTMITGCALLTYAGCKAYSFYTGANHIGGGIPKGVPGAILSGGFILPLNICVGIIVALTMYGFYSLFSKGDL